MQLFATKLGKCTSLSTNQQTKVSISSLYIDSLLYKDVRLCMKSVRQYFFKILFFFGQTWNDQFSHLAARNFVTCKCCYNNLVKILLTYMNLTMYHTQINIHSNKVVYLIFYLFWTRKHNKCYITCNIYSKPIYVPITVYKN